MWTAPTVVGTISAAASKVLVAQLKIQRIERHRLRSLVLRKILRRQTHHHAGRSKHIVAFHVSLVRPTFRGWFRNESISRSPCCGSPVDAQRYPQNIRGIGLERNRPSSPLQD